MTPTAVTYQLHDWSIRSEVTLPACTLPADTSRHDLQIQYGPRRHVPDTAPAGHPLALLDDPQGVALCQTQTGHTLRFYGTCDFELDQTARVLTVHLDHRADARLAELLLTSSALSFLLELRGQSVIHASAVVLDDRAVAFIGPSACGKTSLAAALCAQGAPLLSDDVLCCYLSPLPRCHRGAVALRLRTESHHLAGLFPNAEQSIDQRCVVQATPARDTNYPLAALLAPESAATLHLARCSGVDAVALLLKAARVTSWCSSEQARQQFSALATLARHVPVYRLGLPTDLVLTADGRRSLTNTVLSLLDTPGGS